MTGLTEKHVFIWNKQGLNNFEWLLWWIDKSKFSIFSAHWWIIWWIASITAVENPLDHSTSTLYDTSAHDPLATVPCLTHGTNFIVVWFILIFVPNQSWLLFMVLTVLCGHVCVPSHFIGQLKFSLQAISWLL